MTDLWYTDADVDCVARALWLHLSDVKKLPYEVIKTPYRDIAEIAIAALSERKS